MISQARKKGEETFKNIIEDAKREAQKEVVALREQYENEIEKLREKAEGRIQKAVDLIVERIVTFHGNC